MVDEYQRALGRKIAFHRKRRGLSQREFATLLDRSEAWVSQVERGVRRVDRMSVLEHVAGVLGLPLAELAAEAPVVAAATDAPPGASRLRLTLSSAYSLRAMLSGSSVPETATLVSQAEQAWSLVHASQYADLSDLVESLIPCLEGAARRATNGQRTELFRLLATVYQACSAALAKLGEPEAAWVAGDRAIVAAERAGDPLLMAAGEFRLVIVFLGARRYEQAARTSETAADALLPVRDDTTESAALWGALTLLRAVTAANRNEAEDAYRFLDQAAEIAKRVGEGRNDYNTEFGPTNVALHRVVVAVELGDAGVALRAAQAVDAGNLSAERQARFLIDVARAYVQRRQPSEAVATLERAELIAPEQVRAHRLVLQLVTDLLGIQDPPSTELVSLARRLGVSG